MDRTQKRSPGAQASHSPFRRRRIIFFSLLIITIIFFFGAPWELSSALKEAGVVPTGLSRANIASLVKSNRVDEIYGLLHFVTRNDQILLSTPTELDPSKPIDLGVYGGAKEDWKKNVEVLNEEYPVIIFSKARPFFKLQACMSLLLISAVRLSRHTARPYLSGSFSRAKTAHLSSIRYSRSAKELLATYDLMPVPKIVEVDIRGMLRKISPWEM